jgi:hypothetical protein
MVFNKTKLIPIYRHSETSPTPITVAVSPYLSNFHNAKASLDQACVDLNINVQANLYTLHYDNLGYYLFVLAHT